MMVSPMPNRNGPKAAIAPVQPRIWAESSPETEMAPPSPWSMSPGTAAEILDDEAAFDPVFAPTRRPILEFTRAEAIAEFTHQQVSSAFESGLSLTPFLHAQDLQAVFAPMAESLHDRLPDVVGLHPDLVAFACLSRKDPESVGRIVRHLKGCFT